MPQLNPSVEAVEIAAMKRRILIADDPFPSMRLAKSGEDKLTPQAQRCAVEIATRGTNSPKLKCFVSGETSGRFRDHSRSCGYSDQFAVVAQTVENLTTIVRPVPRPHLVPPCDETAIQFLSADRVERYEGRNEHSVIRPSRSSSPVACAFWPVPISASAYSAAPYRRSLRPPLAALGFWADLSCDQRLVGEPLSGRAVYEAVEPGQRMQLDVALVQPEGELVNVPAQMLRAGVMVDAENAPLHDREDALDTVGRHVAAHELAGAVIDRLVIEEQPGETTVGSELVSVQHGADFDILVDRSVNGFLIGVRDRLCLYPAAGAFAHSQNGSLADRAAPRVQLFLLVLIGLDAANVGFVNLDDAGQLVEFGTARLAQPVQQKPCRLLRDADLFRQLQAAHPSNNLAKLPFDPSVRVPRTRLRPRYGDGFDGAPLTVRRPRGEGRAVGGGADDPARPANPASAGAGES
jgi:hypothetical protein